jgi:hypothetical protein
MCTFSHAMRQASDTPYTLLLASTSSPGSSICPGGGGAGAGVASRPSRLPPDVLLPLLLAAGARAALSALLARALCLLDA